MIYLIVWLIASNVLLYSWYRYAKRNRLAEQRRKQLEQRLREYPLDAFPQQRYELTAHDVMRVKELVDGVKR